MTLARPGDPPAAHASRADARARAIQRLSPGASRALERARLRQRSASSGFGACRRRPFASGPGPVTVSGVRVRVHPGPSPSQSQRTRSWRTRKSDDMRLASDSGHWARPAGGVTRAGTGQRSTGSWEDDKL